MSTTYVTRLFGGRDIGVVFDADSGTLSIAGHSIGLSTLSAGLQSRWHDAVASTAPASNQVDGNGNSVLGRAAFGGDKVDIAVGAILDATPSWANAIRATIATIP